MKKTLVAVWIEVGSESTVGRAFDEHGYDKGWIRATSEAMFKHVCFDRWEGVEFVWLGIRPRSLIEEPAAIWDLMGTSREWAA